MKAVYYVATALVGVVMFGAGLLVRPALGPWDQQETAAVPEEEAKAQQTEQSLEELMAQGYVSADALKVRIDDGEVQWFDGVMWHAAASVEEMTKEDKFYGAQESFRQFEEQLKQQEADRAKEDTVSGQEVALTIGEKEEPKPTAKPAPTKPAVTAPVSAPVVTPVLEPVVTPAPAPESNGGGDSQPSAPAPDSGNSGSDGGNSGGGDIGNSGDGGNSGSGGGDTGNSGDGGGSSSGGGDTGSGDSGGDQGGGDSGGSDTGDGENMEWSDDYL